MLAAPNGAKRKKRSQTSPVLHESEIAWNAAETRLNTAHAIQEEADADQRVRMAAAEMNQDFIVGHFMLDDTINGRTVVKVLSGLRLFERLYPRKPITLELNSPGGVISEGFHLYDELLRLRKAGHHLTIRGRGEIASMASVVLQAGDVRELGPSVHCMLHQSSGGAAGKSSEIAVAAAYMAMLETRMCEIFAMRSGKPIKTFQELLKKGQDRWLTAAETVKMGLADKIA